MNKGIIRIIVVDDHPAVRKSIKILLGTNPGFEIIAECEDGHSAIEQATQLIPDIMLVDINMSPVDGFEVTEVVLKKVPSVKIIALSINNQLKYATEMLRAGARGYLTKTSPPKEIIQSIIDVHNGDIYICHEIRKLIPPSD
ncbi:MAG: response regulator transcription factor [Chitinophagaceae bacterium]|nr:response regulator transcription factor [Chitinophagaceae bacterium]